MEKDKHLGLRIDSETHKKLKSLAEFDGRSINGEVLYLNILQIESIECIPETKIKMMNGYYYLVKDKAESVVEQLRAFCHSCIAPDREI